MSVKEVVLEEIETLNEEKLQRVAEFVAFLRFQDRLGVKPVIDEAKTAALYAEFADEDRALAEEGIEDYTAKLEREDAQ
ncbi:MAG: hypothetical protein JMDDDDMK_03515 [Acidobacteria bacterium]|nr:hypothetical protein [Acidobacteriota bacterium]